MKYQLDHPRGLAAVHCEPGRRGTRRDELGRRFKEIRGDSGWVCGIEPRRSKPLSVEDDHGNAGECRDHPQVAVKARGRIEHRYEGRDVETHGASAGTQRQRRLFGRDMNEVSEIEHCERRAISAGAVEVSAALPGRHNDLDVGVICHELLHERSERHSRARGQLIPHVDPHAGRGGGASRRDRTRSALHGREAAGAVVGAVIAVASKSVVTSTDGGAATVARAASPAPVDSPEHAAIKSTALTPTRAVPAFSLTGKQRSRHVGPVRSCERPRSCSLKFPTL